MYKVRWELMDGSPARDTDPMTLNEALDFMCDLAKASSNTGGFKSIEIKPAG